MTSAGELAALWPCVKALIEAYDSGSFRALDNKMTLLKATFAQLEKLRAREHGNQKHIREAHSRPQIHHLTQTVPKG